MSTTAKYELPGALHGRVSMLYDGGCPLCAKEIAHYQRIDHQQQVNWVDINRDSTVLDAIGVSKTAAMRHLHVINANGHIDRGAYAFATVWGELPYYRCFARIVRIPGVLRMLDKAYGIFAEKRFRRRARCDSGFCS